MTVAPLVIAAWSAPSPWRQFWSPPIVSPPPPDDDDDDPPGDED